jgi:predicted nucleic acid-binding protein
MSRRILVDSNIFLDIIKGDAAWGEWSAKAIGKHLLTDTLVINPIIYGELAFDFDRIEDLDDILPASNYQYASIPREAAFLAAQVHARYRAQGGTRSMILPDFLVGAHATVERMTLMTRDARRYKTYFPALPLISPDSRQAGLK